MHKISKKMAQKKSAANVRRSFNKWMCANYNSLREKCLFTNLFGELVYQWQEDILHNTYLAIFETLTNETEEEFEDLFISSFRKYTKCAFSARVKEIVPEETFWRYQKQVEEETSEEDQARKEAKHDLAVQMLAAAKLVFSKDEYMIFKLYFESGFNFREIGDLFGTSGQAIGHRYNNLCGRLFGMYKHTLNTI